MHAAAMPPRTPTPLIKVDVKKKAEEQTPVPHNRWHPDIPAVGAAHCVMPTGMWDSDAYVAYPAAVLCRRPRGGCSFGPDTLSSHTQVGEVSEGELFHVEVRAPARGIGMMCCCLLHTICGPSLLISCCHARLRLQLRHCSCLTSVLLRTDHRMDWRPDQGRRRCGGHQDC